MSDKAQNASRAGQAYQDSVKADPATHAALRRVQTRLRVFGQAVRTAIRPVEAARKAAASASSNSMRVYQQLGAALGIALREGRFDRLRVFVGKYPELKQAADDLERAIRESRRVREERCREISLRFRDIAAVMNDAQSFLTVSPPAFDDPAFWSSIRPIGEQIRDAVREAMREQTAGRGRKVTVKDVAAQLEGYRGAGGPYLDQRTFCKLCGCRSASTVSKAISANDDLKRWKDTALKARKSKAAPRRHAGDFTIVVDQVPVASKSAVPREDVDTIMGKLCRQAQGNSEWVQTLNSMSPDERARIAQLYADADYEPSPLEDCPPDKRPRRVKRHGRV